MSSLTTEADRNCRSTLYSSVNVPVCRSKTAIPAVTPAGIGGAVTAAAGAAGSASAAHSRATAAASLRVRCLMVPLKVGVRTPSGHVTGSGTWQVPGTADAEPVLCSWSSTAELEGTGDQTRDIGGHGDRYRFHPTFGGHVDDWYVDTGSP